MECLDRAAPPLILESMNLSPQLSSTTLGLWGRSLHPRGLHVLVINPGGSIEHPYQLGSRRTQMQAGNWGQLLKASAKGKTGHSARHYPCSSSQKQPPTGLMDTDVLCSRKTTAHLKGPDSFASPLLWVFLHPQSPLPALLLRSLPLPVPALPCVASFPL